MNKIDQIKAEIGWLKICSMSAKKEWINDGYNQNAFAEDCRIASFDKLLAFIDSLPEEQPSEGLEKAAWEYASMECERVAFIAGGKWQRDAYFEKRADATLASLAKDGVTLADLVAYDKGVAEGRRMQREETNEKIQNAIGHAQKCYWQSIEDKDTEKSYYWGGGEDCLRALQIDIEED